jgi:hypothetical protein
VCKQQKYKRTAIGEQVDIRSDVVPIFKGLLKSFVMSWFIFSSKALYSGKELIENDSCDDMGGASDDTFVSGAVNV